MKKILALILSLITVFTLASCGAKGEDAMNGMADAEAPENIGSLTNTDGGTGATIGEFIENDFIKTSDEAISTFSADVDTASYAYFRKLVNSGYAIDELIATAGSNIRTEEMLNYFKYSYTLPTDSELFGVSVKIADCPWNPEAKLMALGLATEATEPQSDNNLVFLIDVSGSMMAEDKLPLLQKTFSYLVDNLDSGDRVSIVTYSGKEKVVLKGCEGNKKEKIMEAIESLEAKGSTNGEAGLEKAYQLAEQYYIAGGNNRIIMASDGDLNVGISSSEELKAYISEKKDQGVYLSVLGFGTGNYKDGAMEALADNGNGVYYYIDSEREAEKIFGEDIFSTLYTVAKNVKLQLRFESDTVESYRLVGYENRLLNKEDYLDDTKDAGELGAGHTVTVCYELILKDGVTEESELCELGVRYMKPDSDKSEEQTFTVSGRYITDEPDDEFEFMCSVIETSMILHKSEYIGDISISDVYETLTSTQLGDDEYKREFAALIEKLNR